MTKQTNWLAACFAAYWESEVMTPHGKIMPEKYGRDSIHFNGPYAAYTHDECQLLLTPLSRITDEDAIEVVSIGGWSPQNQGKLLSCRFDFNSNEFIAEFENSRYRVTINAEVIDFLRSRSYDLGFREEQSLISAGIAVEKEGV